MNDAIVKLYAREQIKRQLTREDIKPSWIKKSTLDFLVRQLIRSDPDIKRLAYKWFNGKSPIS